MKTQVCIHCFVCVSSNITVFAWSHTNKWAEFRVLMSRVNCIRFKLCTSNRRLCAISPLPTANSHPF
uniref:Uncharacterized protein n=1 Tax=Caenorhabditis japonica TaxID=281687 RepID=A0A8R1IQY8_CAEJA